MFCFCFRFCFLKENTERDEGKMFAVFMRQAISLGNCLNQT